MLIDYFEDLFKRDVRRKMHDKISSLTRTLTMGGPLAALAGKKKQSIVNESEISMEDESEDKKNIADAE